MGIKAGETLSTFWGNDDLGYATKSSGIARGTGFVFFTVKANDLLSFQGELGYVKKGKHIDLDYTTLMDSAKTPKVTNNFWQEMYTPEYIEMPVLVKMHLPLKLPIQLFVYGGPQVDYLYAFQKYINDNGTIQLENLRDNSKRYDLGLALGCSCEIPFFSGTIILDGRASEGFCPIVEPTEVEKQLDPDINYIDRKNRTVYLMVGYAYRF